MPKRLKKTAVIWILLLAVLWMGGCGLEKKNVQKVKDLSFTVVEEGKIPEELKQTIEEKKKEGFKLTYADQGDWYLAIGYGEQKTGGYSISADECYLTKNAVYFKTTLIGPQKGEKVNEAVSYPYLVIKTEHLEKNVVFD